MLEGTFSATFTSMRSTFCSCEKHLSHMTMLVLGTIHLKMGEKESIMSMSRLGSYHPRGRNFNQGLGKPRNSYPLGEISLSCMDAHDGFLYSHVVAYIFIYLWHIFISVITPEFCGLPNDKNQYKTKPTIRPL